MLSFFSITQAYAQLPLPEGNFSLPDSQRPATLFSFGQFTIDKNQKQIFFSPAYLEGRSQSYTSFEIQFVQGITDELSYLIALPLALRFTENNQRSSGFSDTQIQLEYVALSHSDLRQEIELSFVGSGSIPTGSYKKMPATGFGSPVLFFGSTLSRMGAKWYLFADAGLTWYTPQKDEQYGQSFEYDAGIGRYLFNQPGAGYWFAMVEMNAESANRNRQLGIVNPDSGGRTIYLSPSVVFASKTFYIQFGAGVPVYQKLNGQQNKESFFTALYLGWTFES